METTTAIKPILPASITPTRLWYSFPSAALDATAELEAVPAKALLSELAILYFGEDGVAPDYMTVRDRICAIHLSLNSQNSVAPRFRPIKRAKSAHGLSDAEKNLTNDLQVIDLHWLACRGFQPHHKDWQSMFTPVFRLDRAAKFVNSVGSGENKVLALGITEDREWALSVIQSKAIRSRWNDFNRHRQEEYLKFSNALAKRPRIPEALIPDRFHCYEALYLARWQRTNAANIYRLRTGEPIKQQAMSERLKLFKALGLVRESV